MCDDRCIIVYYYRHYDCSSHNSEELLERAAPYRLAAAASDIPRMLIAGGSSAGKIAELLGRSIDADAEPWPDDLVRELKSAYWRFCKVINTLQGQVTGMAPGDAVYVYEGDTSSVTTLRDEGFTKYITGELEFEGETIADDAKWTEDQLDSITYSGAMNWSRSDTKTSFESLMGDAANAEIKWFYSEDDELAMGILEALEGGGIDDATKETFLGNGPVLSGCGGLDEFYAVLRGETYTDIAEKFSGLVSVTYSPAMIQTAIQDMVDYLNGDEVEQDHVIACENVTAENVADYPSF